MKTISTLLAAALVAAGLGATAQTTPAPAAATPAVATPEATAPVAATTTAAAAPAPASEPTLSPAAARARAMTSRSGRGRATAAPAAKTAPGLKDGVTVRDGKVIATESGRSTVLADSTQTVKLVTGLEAAGTGVVTRPDGTTETLQEGDYISLTGRLESAADRKAHTQSLKENLKEDRKIAAKKARSPLRQLANGF